MHGYINQLNNYDYSRMPQSTIYDIHLKLIRYHIG